MKKKLLITMGILLTLLFIGYFQLPQETGHVLSKDENSIWILEVPPAKQDQYTIEEVKEIVQEGGTIYQMDKVPSFIKNKIKVGQRVKVFRPNNLLYASAPAQGDALFIMILDEKWCKECKD